MTPAISVTRLTRRYRDHTALDDVSFTVPGDTITGLLGRNGAGKTTLLRILAGQEFPSAGSAKVLGAPPAENEDVLRRLVFVREDQVYPEISAGQALRAASWFHPNWDPALASSLLDAFEVRTSKAIKRLSRGQRSALGITIGLAARAEVTLFDEPYAGLDAVARQVFYDRLLADFAEFPRTVLLSTHLIDEAAALFVVVVGLGNVGTRVATLVQGLGIPVVCIERDVNARGIPAVRALDIPVLTGEAPLEHHLRQARVHRSRAVIAMTGDDAANLEACLEARAIAPDVRIVLRIFDDDFATQLYRSFANAASRSVSYVAAPAFAAALMGREVLGTLSIYRHVVLVAEFVAEEGSELVGQQIRDIEVPGEIRVLAVRSPTAREYLWRPDHGRHIGPGDRYVLLTTRAGLGRHTSRVSRSTSSPAAP
jgi:ABC-type Na+ transport system ATPase subunit NatA/Trk K+ transport system NAD-binding subunit